MHIGTQITRIVTVADSLITYWQVMDIKPNILFNHALNTGRTLTLRH